MMSATSDGIMALWLLVTGLLNLVLLVTWIYGFVVSLRLMKWYSAAGGFLAFGTGLSGLTILLSGVIQVSYFLFSQNNYFSGSELNQLIMLTQGIGSFLAIISVISLMTGLTMLVNRCRDLQRAD